jgi:hypothetical protein
MEPQIVRYFEIPDHSAAAGVIDHASCKRQIALQGHLVAAAGR